MKIYFFQWLIGFIFLLVTVFITCGSGKMITNIPSRHSSEIRSNTGNLAVESGDINRFRNEKKKKKLSAERGSEKNQKKLEGKRKGTGQSHGIWKPGYYIPENVITCLNLWRSARNLTSVNIPQNENISAGNRNVQRKKNPNLRPTTRMIRKRARSTTIRPTLSSYRKRKHKTRTPQVSTSPSVLNKKKRISLKTINNSPVTERNSAELIETAERLKKYWILFPKKRGLNTYPMNRVCSDKDAEELRSIRSDMNLRVNILVDCDGVCRPPPQDTKQ